ncbi:hypothetical protein ABIA30_001191 [Mycobacterium sp. MAA66]|uniref:DUF732 domain-containing protein n=1 Tax=Mycobacterium sp. MAA66 TaxID=3156297 RepID=UPI003510D3BF
MTDVLNHRHLAGAAAAVAALAAAVLNPPAAQADTAGYLINITVRPGYQFAGPDDALRYGRGLCDDVGAGHPYSVVIGQVKADQQTADEYQAGYLINQAIDELCPEQIWQLRQSAAGYKPTSEPG